ncbi:MAG: ATP-binding protein [Proteobacteria bacterium]|nr:ATP-binding protein [Pseudomonadota bacterium]
MAQRRLMTIMQVFPESGSPHGSYNLRLLLWLRGLAIIGLSLMVALAQNLFHILIPFTPVLSLLVLWAALNLLTWLRLKHPTQVSDTELLAQLSIDPIMLTALLAFTGGPANPLTSLYLPPVAVAAAVLPMRHAWMMAALSVTAYSLLWKFSVPLTVEDVDSAMQMHLIGMWLTFAASALLIAGFVTRMTVALRGRDRQLAAAREEALRDERIVALGNLAAGAAHELGTPLATMAVIAGELASDPATPSELRVDLELLREQIAACKGIITGLAERAGSSRAESGSAIAVDRWMEKLVARWRSLRPQVEPRLLSTGVVAAPSIVGEATLEQALLSLFNNAADASSSDVEIVVHWTHDHLQLKILDRGPGIAEALRLRAGREYFSTRPEGAGIGLFLAHATLNRFGGDIFLEPRPGGGTLTRIELPLKTLLANDT